MLPPAPDLAVWFSDLLEYRESPDLLDYDQLEDALDQLFDRAQLERSRLEELDAQAPISPILWGMLGHLEQIAEELDLFLETELFYHLEQAHQLSKSLLEQRRHLEAELTAPLNLCQDRQQR